MSADKRLKENNIVLPEAPAPVGSYLASKIVGKLLLEFKKTKENEIMINK